MSLIHYVYLFFLTVPVFIVLDLLWLGVVARGFYQSQLGHLMGPVQWMPAVVFYVLYTIGVIFFAVRPGLDAGSLVTSLIYGALFGLIAYATYDLTNHATLREWPLVVSVVDIFWGALLTGTVATASYFIGKSLFL